MEYSALHAPNLFAWLVLAVFQKGKFEEGNSQIRYTYIYIYKQNSNTYTTHTPDTTTKLKTVFFFFFFFFFERYAPNERWPRCARLGGTGRHTPWRTSLVSESTTLRLCAKCRWKASFRSGFCTNTTKSCLLYHRWTS